MSWESHAIVHEPTNKKNIKDKPCVSSDLSCSWTHGAALLKLWGRDASTAANVQDPAGSSKPQTALGGQQRMP